MIEDVLFLVANAFSKRLKLFFGDPRNFQHFSNSPSDLRNIDCGLTFYSICKEESDFLV